MMNNKNLTIMFTDMKGFTSRTSSQSRTATIDMIRTHKELLAPVIADRGGRLIKTIGDAFLVTFESPTDAVLAGIALQKILAEHNPKLPEQERIHIRVAINTGEVSIEEGDVYGEAVNIAARIEGIAEANEVYFTEATYLAMNKAEVPSAEIGYRMLKGIPHKIKVYRVLHEGEKDPGPAPEMIFDEKSGAPSMKPAPIGRRAAAFAVDGLIVFLTVLLLTAPANSKIEREHHQLMEDLMAAGFHSQKDVPDHHLMHERIDSYNNNKTKLVSFRKGLFLILFFIYSTVLIGRRGQTVGKRFLHLRVVRTDGARIWMKVAAQRTALYFLSAVFLFLGFAWALFDQLRQTWHDKIAGTLVIGEGNS